VLLEIGRRRSPEDSSSPNYPQSYKSYHDCCRGRFEKPLLQADSCRYRNARKRGPGEDIGPYGVFEPVAKSFVRFGGCHPVIPADTRATAEVTSLQYWPKPHIMVCRKLFRATIYLKNQCETFASKLGASIRLMKWSRNRLRSALGTFHEVI
jgi:hypothetical protein